MHNYLKKISRRVAEGTWPEFVGLGDLFIEHDDFCLIFHGGECNCDPFITLTTGLSVEEHLRRIADSAGRFAEIVRQKRL
jgi:hypothetical protein